MILRNIHDTFSAEGYLFIGFESSKGWFFTDKNIQLDDSGFLENYSDYEVDWIYLNEYEGKEGLAVVLKGSPKVN